MTYSSELRLLLSLLRLLLLKLLLLKMLLSPLVLLLLLPLPSQDFFSAPVLVPATAPALFSASALFVFSSALTLAAGFLSLSPASSSTWLPFSL